MRVNVLGNGDHAVRYMGQSKDAIAEQHLENRKHVSLNE